MTPAAPDVRADLAASLQAFALGIRAACDARPAHAGRSAYSVALAASRPGDGTTSLVCHLARILEADLGLKVCLLDADLGVPSLHAVYGTPLLPGFGELAAGAAGLDEVLAVAENGRLAILPAGTSPGGRVPRLPRGFLREVADGLGRKGYDVLLVDCPAILPNPEVPVLAAQAEIAYLVVRSEGTRLPDAQGAVTSLRSAGCDVGGVVLNRVKRHVPALLANFV